jgi:hypothetical protein
MEGRRMVMILAPKAGVVRKAAEARKAAIAAQLAHKTHPSVAGGKKPDGKGQEELAPLDQSEFDEDEDDDDDMTDDTTGSS